MEAVRATPAEIFVERQQNARVSFSPGKDFGVAHSRRGRPNPGHIMPSGSKRCHRISRKILVREEAHSGSARVDLLRRQYIPCIRQTSGDILLRNARIVV